MMDSFELTKIVGWVLAALLVIVGTRTIIDLKLAGHGHKAVGYALPMPDAAGGGAGHGAAPAPAAAAFDAAKVAALAATASPEAGKDVFGKCKACHTVEPGKNGVGPSLAGVVGRKVGSAPGFSYSPAMQGKGGEWTPEALATFLNDPKATVPGNKMSFAGFKGDVDAISAVIAYLKTTQ